MNAWQWLSYLIPIPIKKISSPVNGEMEINWENGKKVLNTKNANYSYGSLHRVFQKALAEIDFSANAFSSCLILGFGAGSIYSILRNEYNCPLPITGVELDESYKEINLEFIPNLYNAEVLYADAINFIAENEKEFPLILCDLFVDKDTVKDVFDLRFIKDIEKSLEPGGVYIHNTMFFDKGEELKYFSLLERVFEYVDFKEYLGSNSVFICTKSKKTNPS